MAKAIAGEMRHGIPCWKDFVAGRIPANGREQASEHGGRRAAMAFGRNAGSRLKAHINCILTRLGYIRSRPDPGIMDTVRISACALSALR